MSDFSWRAATIFELRLSLASVFFFFFLEKCDKSIVDKGTVEFMKISRPLKN